jgi:type I restriction enzyme S subunit
MIKKDYKITMIKNVNKMDLNNQHNKKSRNQENLEKSRFRPIGNYIQEVKVKNTDLKAKNLLGINIDKFFMPSVANVIGTDLSGYKVVSKNQFACNLMHVGRDERIPVSLSDKNEVFMVSPAYEVFEVKNTDELLPEYLMMWFSRKEFDRNAWFYTDADVRGGLPWKSFCEMTFPLLPISTQRALVAEYNVVQNRIKLNRQLIQKLEQTAQAIYKKYFVEEVDRENLPKGWRVGKLSDIATIIMGQSPEGETYNKEKKGMIFYQGRTDFGYRFPNITTYTTQPKRKAKKDDILMSVRAPVGDLNITIEDCAIGRGVAALRSKINCNSYLFYLLKSMKSLFDISDEDGTIFGSINKDDLHNMEVVYSNEIIKKFEKIVKPINDLIILKSQETQKLQTLQSLLLAKMASTENNRVFAGINTNIVTL